MNPDWPGRCFPSSNRSVVEQALVDVTDLFDAECTERNPPCFRRAASARLYTQPLERIEQVQDDTVVYRQRFGDRAPPRATCGPTFEKWVAVRIEQGAAVGLHQQILVLNATMDSPEAGEQSRPGIVAAL